MLVLVRFLGAQDVSTAPVPREEDPCAAIFDATILVAQAALERRDVLTWTVAGAGMLSKLAESAATADDHERDRIASFAGVVLGGPEVHWEIPNACGRALVELLIYMGRLSTWGWLRIIVSLAPRITPNARKNTHVSFVLVLG